MSVFSGDGPWLTAIIFAVLFLVIFRRPLGWLIRLAFRSLLGVGFLAAWSYSGIAAGLALGVNAFNAITLGLLGLPGAAGQKQQAQDQSGKAPDHKGASIRGHGSFLLSNYKY